ncbi:MAG: serine endoprotease DegQ [Sedimenticola sp.]|nr:MAG: serine endoprotease DegQ [Sedimenticola sp.]
MSRRYTSTPLFWTILAPIILFLFLSASSTLLLAKAPPPTNSLAPMLEGVLPAVVNISTKKLLRRRHHPLQDDPFFRHFFNLRDPGEESQKRSSLGSGVIIDAELGYVLTNHHVIDGADEITITLRDRRKYNAQIIGQDPEVDLALLQIDAEALTALKLADSGELRVGDFVVAIGNPFGLGQTVTYGIVSALGRTGLGIEGYENFIQTDASINPGNSGGALVNMEGDLVGINTAIVGPNGGNVGIGFAIPSNMTQAIIRHLVKYGEIRRGHIGIVMQDLTPELANAFGLGQQEGAVVSQVFPNSPASEDGIRSGDIITRLNDEIVSSSSQLRNALGLLTIGERVELGIVREGKPLRIITRIGDPDENLVQGSEISPYLAGAGLAPIASNHPLAGKIEGVEVVKVEGNSRAHGAGIRAGDIIVSINRMPVTHLEQLKQAASLNPNALSMNIRRGNSTLFISLR